MPRACNVSWPPATPVEPRVLGPSMEDGGGGNVVLESTKRGYIVLCLDVYTLMLRMQRVGAMAAMRVHLDEQTSGRLAGPEPFDLLDAQGLSVGLDPQRHQP
eukprot:1825007-Amphidinium_carterae.3